MRISPTVRRWLPVLLFSSALPVVGLAQDAKKVPDASPPVVAVVDRAGPWVRARESRVPPLRRTVALRLNNASLRSALDAIGRSAGLTVGYGEDVLRSTVRVTLRVSGMPLIDALTTVLDGTGLDAFISVRGDALLVRSALAARAPTGAIVGYVTDAKTGDKLVKADVYLDGTRWQAATDTGGRYRLADVDTGQYTLAVRRLGYAKQSRRVTVRDGQTDTVNVALEPRVARLEELVTTAAGPRRRLDVANDVTTINADSVMQAAPIRSLTDLLEGRVPGMTVQRTSGAPGDPARIRMRGVSSPLRGNDPIVVVDGIRVYAEQSAARSGNLANRWDRNDPSNRDSISVANYAAPSPLDYIDPNSIETIEVLSGPSAATLYGQDAANGVIVITTKKGKAGPARWTANVEHGRTHMEGEYPELLYRWGHLYDSDSLVNCPITNIHNGASCIADSLTTFQLLSDPALTVLDRGHRTALSLGVSGGTPSLRYAVTGSYSDETGLVKLPAYETDRFQSLLGLVPPDWMRRPQQFKQWGATSRITARLGATADVSLIAGLSRTEQQRSSLENQLGDLMGTFLDQTSGTYYRRTSPAIATNPSYAGAVGDALRNYYERATAVATQFTSGASFQWQPRSWLRVDADAGLNLQQRADQVYFPRGPAGVNLADTTGRVSDGQGTALLSTVNLRANALTPIGRGLQLRVAAGANYAGTRTNDVAGGSANLPPGSSLQGDSITFLRRAEQSDATFGWYLEPSVGNSKFNFSLGLRLDGGSSYGSSLKGLSLPKFPKLGFSYLLSEEPFFPFKSLFQSFRVRAAYGRASRQPGATDRLRLYSLPVQGFADGQSGTVVTLLTLGNTEVRPERSSEFEGGFDTDLLDSRLTLSFTGYRKTTDDALLSVPVAPSVYGAGVTMIKNIGVIRNTGLTLTAGAQLVRSGPVTWTTQLSMSQNRNIVVKLGPEVAPFYTSGVAGSGGIRVVAGYPLFGRWSVPVLGYADANGNGVLEPQEVQVGDTAVYVGATLPNFMADLSTTLSLWHGAVVVNAGFDYQDGLAQENTVARDLGFFSHGRQDPTASVAEQLNTADLLRNPQEPIFSNYNWIQTVNTLRFNSLAVRYNVPPALARRVGAQTLSVAVQGGNLGLWTNYRGLDPSVNAFSTGNNVTDTGVLPQPRTWQVQLHLTY